MGATPLGPTTSDVPTLTISVMAGSPDGAELGLAVATRTGSRACSMSSSGRAARSYPAIRVLALVGRLHAHVAPRANIAS